MNRAMTLRMGLFVLIINTQYAAVPQGILVVQIRAQGTHLWYCTQDGANSGGTMAVGSGLAL